MGNSNALLIYIFLLLFFNFFAGSFLISEDTDAQNKIESYKVIGKARAVLSDKDGFFSSVLKVVLVPFLVLDLIFTIIFTMTVTLYGLPNIVNILLYSPLVLIAIIDYVIPTIRGN